MSEASEIKQGRSNYSKGDRLAIMMAKEKKSVLLMELTLAWNTLKTNGLTKISNALFVSALVNLGLFVLVFVLAFRPAEVRFITTNAAGQVIEIPSVKQAMYDDIQAKQYALRAVNHLFTLHQDAFKTELEEHTGSYMVPGGREIFYKGLEQMNLLGFLNDVSKHPGATVSINTAIGPTITLTSKIDEGMGRHAWSFRVPAAITISDQNNGSSTSKHLFTVKLVRLNMNEKTDGIGVMKIVESQKI